MIGNFDRVRSSLYFLDSNLDKVDQIGVLSQELLPLGIHGKPIKDLAYLEAKFKLVSAQNCF